MEIKSKIIEVAEDYKKKFKEFNIYEKLFFYVILFSLFNSFISLFWGASQYKVFNLIFMQPYSTFFYFLFFIINIFIVYLYLNKKFNKVYLLYLLFLIFNFTSGFYKFYIKLYFFKKISGATLIINKFFNIGLLIIFFNLILVSLILYMMYKKKYIKVTKYFLVFFLSLNIFIGGVGYYMSFEDYFELENAYKKISEENTKLSFVACRGVCSNLQSVCFLSLPSALGIKNLTYEDYKTSDVEIKYINKQNLLAGIAMFNKDVKACDKLEKESSKWYCKKIITGDKKYCENITDDIRRRACKYSFTYYTKDTLCEEINSEKAKEDCFQRISLYI